MTLLLLWFCFGFQEKSTSNPILARCGALEIRQDAFEAATKLSQQIPKAEANEKKTRNLRILKKLMIQKIFENDSSIHAHMQEPDFRNRVQWRVVVALAQKENLHLFDSLPPMPEAVLLEQFEEAKKAHAEDLRITFRHITLRKDEKRKFSTEKEVSDFADVLLRRIQSGEDFATLAKAHSQSATAINGGLVKNSRLKELDKGLGALFKKLAPGDLSDVIPTRTGFHIFQMVHKGTARFDEHNTKKQIRSRWQNSHLSIMRQKHLEELGKKWDLQETKAHIQSPTWTFPVAFLVKRIPSLATQKGKDQLRQQLLFAEAALAREGSIQALKQHFQNLERQELGRKLQEGDYQHFVDTLPLERIKTIYEAHKSSFKRKETARVHLIFIPQGANSFATKQRLETLVTELRAGKDFKQTAIALSKGPEAAAGGDLGVLEEHKWSYLHPKIDLAIRNLEDHQVSDPIYCSGKRIGTGSMDLNNGFAIVKVVDKTPEKILSFKEAIPKVRQAYGRQHRAMLEQEWTEITLKKHHFQLIQTPEL